jgi:hypothetical protein
MVSRRLLGLRHAAVPAALATVFLCSAAWSKCPDPAGQVYAAAAMAQFNCSSARDLVPGTSEREFKVTLDFPSDPPPATNLPWKAIDFERQPEAYLRALLAYGIKTIVIRRSTGVLKTTQRVIGAMRPGFIISGSGCMA